MRLSEIAMLIRLDWGNVNYAAEPYLRAMEGLQLITDNYGQDNARSIVRYFLSNAASWRGPVARETKLLLKTMCGDK